jgi:hypothetical protein
MPEVMEQELEVIADLTLVQFQGVMIVMVVVKFIVHIAINIVYNILMISGRSMVGQRFLVPLIGVRISTGKFA